MDWKICDIIFSIMVLITKIKIIKLCMGVKLNGIKEIVIIDIIFENL